MAAYFHPQFAPHSFVDSPIESDFPLLDEIIGWWEQGVSVFLVVKKVNCWMVLPLFNGNRIKQAYLFSPGNLQKM